MAIIPTFSFRCIICHGSSICDKCKVRELSSALKLANDKINFLTRDYHEALQITHIQRLNIDAAFIRSKDPIDILPRLRDMSLSLMKFVTITFDPDKFGSVNESDREKEYILSVLYNLQIHYHFIYGCFEYHKSGTIHAHLIINTTCCNLKQILRPKFTNNPKNHKAIDIGPAKLPQSITYINKESSDYFMYDPQHLPISHLDDNEFE